MKELLHEYWPHMTGLAGSGGLIAFIFRDSIQQFFAERKADKAADRMARAQQQQVPQEYARALLHLLEKTTADNHLETVANRETIKELTAVLQRLSEAIERLGHVSAETHLMVKETRDNTMIIKGAVS
jgi:hypothetical protein